MLRLNATIEAWNTTSHKDKLAVCNTATGFAPQAWGFWQIPFWAIPSPFFLNEWFIYTGTHCIYRTHSWQARTSILSRCWWEPKPPAYNFICINWKNWLEEFSTDWPTGLALVLDLRLMVSWHWEVGGLLDAIPITWRALNHSPIYRSDYESHNYIH